MIEALIARLRLCGALTALLGADAADSHIHPGGVAYPGPGIAYEFTDLTADVPRLSQITLRVVSQDADLSLAIAREVTLALHISDAAPGWWYLDTNILTCKLNGGGQIEMQDVGMFQRFLTFDVKWRDR